MITMPVPIPVILNGWLAHEVIRKKMSLKEIQEIVKNIEIRNFINTGLKFTDEEYKICYHYLVKISYAKWGRL